MKVYTLLSKQNLLISLDKELKSILFFNLFFYVRSFEITHYSDI